MMTPGRLIPNETTVAVLMGGWSAERKVSLSSGEACAGALKRAGFNTIMVDVKRDTIHGVLLDMKPDVVFNALHGKWGEDGHAAAMLETLQIAYTHSGVLGVRPWPCTRKNPRLFSGKRACLLLKANW